MITRSRFCWSASCSLLHSICTYVHTHIQSQYTCIRTYIHTYVHTYMHTYIHTYIRTYVHTYIRTYIHTYVHTYVHTCIHTYIHTYVHTYIYQIIGSQAHKHCRYMPVVVHKYHDTHSRSGAHFSVASIFVCRNEFSAVTPRIFSLSSSNVSL